MTTADTVYARCRLSNEGCGAGPSALIETTDKDAVNAALSWAESQPGHPYDCLLIVVYGDEAERRYLQTHEFESRDGSWEEICSI